MALGATLLLAGLVGYLIRQVFHDPRAVRAATLEITHSAEHDFLTGLPNRTRLNDRISQAIAVAHRHKTKLAVLFLDLDAFEHINVSLGHPIGDKLLQSVARRLVACLRRSDTVSRQGDEFVALLSEVRPTAMYEAKESGCRCYRFFKRAVNGRAVRRQAIEEDLRLALERHQFALHYQPKINLKTGAITGAEALLRWMHPTGRLISRSEFIPIAEDCGLILPIGAWVLREACGQARAFADAGRPVTTMAVNVSATEFRNENFLEGVFTILGETGLDPRLLELELTESVLMKHAESGASVLQTLRERGVQVAVDNLGTGYSRLGYLRKFPVDALKIDQSFIHQISTGGEEAAIVSAVIAMARSLKARVVAEGVETPQQLEFLLAHECDEAQGHYFSRPVPAEQFARLLEMGIPDPSVLLRRPLVMS